MIARIDTQQDRIFFDEAAHGKLFGNFNYLAIDFRQQGGFLQWGHRALGLNLYTQVLFDCLRNVYRYRAVYWLGDFRWRAVKIKQRRNRGGAGQHGHGHQ